MQGNRSHDNSPFEGIDPNIESIRERWRQFDLASSRFVGSALCVAIIVFMSGCVDRTAKEDSTERFGVLSDAAPQTSDVPEVRLDPPSIDFGFVHPGTTLHASVQIINGLEDSVQVLKTRANCGCTVAEKPEQPIDPGKSAPLEIRFTPRGDDGAVVAKSVTVLMDGEHEPLTLNLRATIREIVSIKPRSIDSAVNESATVIVRSQDDEAFTLVAIDPPILVAKHDGASGTAHELTWSRVGWEAAGQPNHIRLTTSHPTTGTISSIVQVKTAKQRASLPRNGYRPAPLDLRPRRINLGSIDQVSTVHIPVRILNAEIDDAVDVVVSCDIEDFNTDLIEATADSNSILLSIQITPTAATASPHERVVLPIRIAYGDRSQVLHAVLRVHNTSPIQETTPSHTTTYEHLSTEGNAR